MSKNETPDQFRDARSYGGHLAELRPKFASGRVSGGRMKLDIYSVIEIFAIATMGLTIAKLYVGDILGVSDYLARYFWPVALLSISLGFLMHRSGLYLLDAVTDFAGSLGKVASSTTGVFILFSVLSVMLGASGDYSRIWFGSWFAGSLVLLWLMRATAAGVFLRWLKLGTMGKRAVVIGDKDGVERFDAGFGGDSQFMTIVGRIVTEPEPTEQKTDEMVAALVAAGRDRLFDVAIVAPPPGDPASIDKLLNAISMLSVEIKIVPPPGLAHLPLIGISRFKEHQFLDLQREPISDWGRLLKRLEDISIALAALVVLALPLALIAAAIKLESRGPVLYKQRRTGLNNREFTIYKFRTMEVERTPGDFRQTQRNDPRVTRVGRFLRRTSLDELAQLLNVLKGEMSIVGPRPHPIDLNRIYEAQMHLYNKRHSVKPGITGWAQIHDHRGPVDTPQQMLKRLNCDLHYIDNWSPLFDLKIIAATPLMSLIHRNAI